MKNRARLLSPLCKTDVGFFADFAPWRLSRKKRVTGECRAMCAPGAQGLESILQDRPRGKPQSATWQDGGARSGVWSGIDRLWRLRAQHSSYCIRAQPRHPGDPPAPNVLVVISSFMSIRPSSFSMSVFCLLRMLSLLGSAYSRTQGTPLFTVPMAKMPSEPPSRAGSILHACSGGHFYLLFDTM